MINRNGDWRSFTPAFLRTHGIYPNRLRYNPNTREGVLAIQQHKWDEYAVSQAGLEYLQRALKEEKITQGYVVLENRLGRQVACKPVGEVLAALEGIPPKEGGLGAYWWFVADLTPQDTLKENDTPYF